MSNRNNVNELIDLVKNMSSKMDEKFEKIENEIVFIKKDVKKNIEKNIEKNNKLESVINKIENLSNKIDKIENEIVIIKKDTDKIQENVQSLLNYKTEMKSYQAINSKEFEKEVTNWLFNYFVNKNYSSHYYIPSYEEIPRNLLNVNATTKKTLTDLDGVIVQTNMDPSKKRNSNNIKYTLHIMESKHKMEVSKIKNKIKQMIKFYRIVNSKNSNIDLSKFRGCDFYLYFASPITTENVFNFVMDKKYLKPETWDIY